MQEWLANPIIWTNDLKSILLRQNNASILDANITLGELIQKSTNFLIKFPIESIRCHYLQHKTSKTLLEENINSVYPIIYEYVLHLCAIFLNYQRNYGFRREFYQKLLLIDLIDRLLHKRAVMFLGAEDQYLLITGKHGFGNWESIGTAEEKEPLILENCLSYDEIKLSALLSVSSFSFFINDGDRYNCGKFDENRDEVEENGVIVGMIGARLEKPKVMEYREIIKTKDQNNADYGYGGDEPSLQKEFLKFYGDSTDTYQDQKEKFKTAKDRYIEIASEQFFDKLMYEKRIAISIDTLLLEANHRAKQQVKKAFIHVVGLGLGVWKIYQGQNKLFMDTFANRLELLSNTLTNIADVRFAYIRESTVGKYKNGDKINGITIHIENINPQTKLKDNDEGKLLVVSYPWDGNAFPGNEFWGGSLSGSGDPAAASSTQVAELHNAHINEKLKGNNLRIATSKGVVTFNEYQEMHLND